MWGHDTDYKRLSRTVAIASSFSAGVSSCAGMSLGSRSPANAGVTGPGSGGPAHPETKSVFFCFFAASLSPPNKQAGHFGGLK